MIIRTMHDSDIPILECMSKKFYPEFESPDFNDGYFSKFVIENDDKSLIIGGGLRTLAEVVLVTDKSKNVHAIGEALLKSLSISVNISKMRHAEFLTAYVQDEGYKEHLIKHGFDPVKGTPLSLYLGKR